MKLLLVSEGKHELSGSLETLVRRLSAHELDIEHDRVSRPNIHAHHGKGQGFFKRAVRWMIKAAEDGYEALVLVVDEDGHPERIQELTRAQGYQGAELRRAFGIAIRTFDAWMLADEQALTSVLACHIQRQPSPEEIREPKQVCKDLCDASSVGISQRTMHAKLAEVIDLATLEQRCPKGFARFAERVRSL